MAKVYMSEYARCVIDSSSHTPFPEGPPIATQVLDTAGTHLSAALNAETRFVRLCSDGVVSFKWGAAPTAATTDERLPANWIEYIGVTRPPNAAAGLKLDVIANT